MCNIEPRLVKINGVDIELRVDPVLEATVLRAFTGGTPTDIEVDTMTTPHGPVWLRTCVRLLKWYRAALSPRLDQRCVYEPSCSRYAEIAFRKYGFFRGFSLTIKRLYRCRPGSGGIDLP